MLSLAILITILMSLTLVPAFLKLLGPRIFWPTSGARFERHARQAAENIAKERTYFYRVGRLTQRRPVVIVAVLIVVSIPLIYLALNVPLAYDFYGQLPTGHPATDGLQSLYQHYGSGFATPSFALVTFSAPLVVGNHTNAVEFTDLAALTSRAENTSGIASVQSPVGPDGASLATWLNLSTLPTAPQQNLLGTLGGFVGTDGTTVLLTLVPSSTGLSQNAVQSVKAVEASFSGYTATHPEIAAVAYGGGAPTIGDLADETSHATLILIIAVSLGLLIVLIAVLRTWIIALMAIATIGLSISWAWAITYLVFQQVLGFPLFFYVRTILFLLILGLGIDYNIFVLDPGARGAPPGTVVQRGGRHGGRADRWDHHGRRPHPRERVRRADGRRVHAHPGDRLLGGRRGHPGRDGRSDVPRPRLPAGPGRPGLEPDRSARPEVDGRDPPDRGPCGRERRRYAVRNRSRACTTCASADEESTTSTTFPDPSIRNVTRRAEPLGFRTPYLVATSFFESAMSGNRRPYLLANAFWAGQSSVLTPTTRTFLAANSAR